MQLQNKKILFFSIFFFVSLTSCKTQQSMLKGFWENEKKIVEFSEDYFIIYNKDSSEIIAFMGTYSFARTPANAVKMNYESCLNSEGVWESLKGTSLEGYTDYLLIRINKDILETKVLGNGQIYVYKRSKNPMNESNY